MGTPGPEKGCLPSAVPSGVHFQTEMVLHGASATCMSLSTSAEKQNEMLACGNDAVVGLALHGKGQGHGHGLAWYGHVQGLGRGHGHGHGHGHAFSRIMAMVIGLSTAMAMELGQGLCLAQPWPRSTQGLFKFVPDPKPKATTCGQNSGPNSKSTKSTKKPEPPVVSGAVRPRVAVPES